MGAMRDADRLRVQMAPSAGSHCSAARKGRAARSSAARDGCCRCPDVDSFLGVPHTLCAGCLMVLCRMNLETMQHEGMPDSMFEEAVKAAKLLPHQLQQLTIAFQTYSDVQAELLQQQQGIMQQLQLLLGAESQSSGGQASPPGSPSGQHSAATASAGNAVPAPTAGPAHFMSLATGAAVKRAEGHTQQTQQACASTGASVPARSATAAEATSGAQTRSALLKAKAAAAAAGAAAAGGSGGGGGSSSAGQGPPLSQAGACQQALGGQQGQGAGSGCDPPAAAAAGGGSSSGTTPSSSGAGTSSSAAGSSSWLVPEGLLCLEDADKAEQLLLEWQRVAHRMKRQARSLGSMVSCCGLQACWLPPCALPPLRRAACRTRGLPLKQQQQPVCLHLPACCAGCRRNGASPSSPSAAACR